MTKDDAATPLWRNPVLVAALSGFGVLFSAGVITGIVMGTFERGAMKPVAVAFAIAAAAILMLCLVALRKSLPAIYAEAPPRVSRSRKLLTISAVLGAVLGMLLVIGSLSTGVEPPSVFSNSAIPAWVAISSLAVWLIVVPPLTWKWHQTIDEHEARAYREGTLAGVYAYCAIAPTWWLAWRGGLLPEPQYMITFLAVIIVWSVVWLVRRG